MTQTDEINAIAARSARRAAIVKELGELRAIVRDLEDHKLPAHASATERNQRFDAFQKAKDRIYTLDLEYLEGSK